jgi:hypothetical protein
MMMTDVDRLLRDYIERYESGGSVDPSDLMEELADQDRRKLAVLIEGYLEHVARPQDWEAEAFKGSVADRAMQRVEDAWTQAAVEQASELVRLRNERHITREDLVTRLADALGVSGARAKVASYYHRLERGLLPTDGVSGRVWDTLAGLLGTTSDSLREAASSTGPADEVTGAAYARLATSDREYDETDAAAEGMASSGALPEEPDEVDRLFTGG